MTPVDPSPYLCHRTLTPPALDGRLESPAWAKATRSARFGDMVTGQPAIFDTRIAALWDDQALYVGFWVEEPFVAADLTERDSLIFMENDVEVFVDGEDCYYEFEINARNTVYEMFFIWQDAYRRGSRFDAPEWDLIDRRALSFGGNFDRSGWNFWQGTHPRGPRWAFRHWDFPGLRSAVYVDGVLNDRNAVSRGWRVELAFPWAGMRWLAGSRPIPPRAGDVWRIFFGRFEKLELAGELPQPQPAWCLTPHGALDTHMPEKFTPVQFSDVCVEDL